MRAALALLVLSACPPKTTPPPAVEEPPAEETEAPTEEAPPAAEESAAVRYPQQLRERMSEHFRHANDADEALVTGDFASAREAAAELAKPAEVPGLDEAGQAYLAAMREAAGRAATAKTDLDTARGIGAMYAACGNCHKALIAKRPMEVPDVPDERWGEVDQMDRHRWGTIWMWMGLIGASEPAWKGGTSQLAAATLQDAGGTTFEGDHRLQTLAAAAVDAPMEKWADSYGEVMVVCGECHAAKDVEPE